MPSSFNCQWKALLWRHYIIKKRNYYQLFLEFFPVLILVLAFKTKFPVTSIAPISLAVSSESHFISSDSINLCVTYSSTSNQVINTINDSLSLRTHKFLVRKVLKNEKLLDEALRKSNGSEDSCHVGVVFSSTNTSDGSYIIKILEDKEINGILSNQSGNVCSPYHKSNCPALKYYGLLSDLQISIDEAFLQEWSSKKNLNIHDHEKYGYILNRANNTETVHELFVFLSIVCLSLVATVLIENILYDEKKKIKETMQLMGMKPLAYWSSWFTIEMIPVFFIMGAISATLFLQEVFSLIPTILIFILMVGFGCSILILSMAITTIIRKSSVANTILIGIYATALLQGYIQNINFFAYFFVRMLAPVPFSQSSLLIFKGEFTLELWISIFQAYAIALFYAVIGLTLDHFFPYEFHFPSFKIKWSRKKKIDKKFNSEKINESKPSEFEEPFNRKEEYLRLENIGKTYDICCKGNNVLDGVSFNIYGGEIVCLLGSNGAGKSTLMKILSTAISPDDGKVTYSPKTNIGICPQENILLEDLSPYEQLLFFGQLKGIPSSELKSTVTKLLHGFDLLHCRNRKTTVLSLGEKRKLCVALAMIGNPEVLLLDEPSSGMSLQSRKQLQNMLTDYSDLGHSVVFTTHYLVEAELIADRIALLNEGKIQCCGSSLFFKKYFGAGYNIKVIFNEEISQEIVLNLVTSSTFQIGEIETETLSRNEILIKLPTSDPSKIAQFVEQLEDLSENNKIVSYSIHSSTLEEMLYCANSQLAEKRIADSKVSLNLNESSTKKEIFRPAKTERNFFQSFAILVQYRLILIFRTPYSLFPILIPVILLFFLKQFTNDDLKFIDVSPSTYTGRNIQAVNLTGNPLRSLERSFSKLNLNVLWKDKDEVNLEASCIKIRIHKLEYVDDQLEIKCDWHFSLNDVLAIPVINNLMSNIIWKNELGNDERTLKLSIQHMMKSESASPSLNSSQFSFLIQAGFCVLFVVYVIGMEVVTEKEDNISPTIYRINETCAPYWFTTLLVHYAQCIISLLAIYSFARILSLGSIESTLMKSLGSIYTLSLPSCLLFVYTTGRWFKTYRNADLGMPLIIFGVSSMLFFLMSTASVVYPEFNDCSLSVMICLIYPLYTPYYVVLILNKFSGPENNDHSIEADWYILCSMMLPISTLLYMTALLWMEYANKNLGKTYSEDGNLLWDESSSDDLLNLYKKSEEAKNTKAFITLKDVRKVYPIKYTCRRRKEKVVLHNLNLTLDKGEIFGLMGSNGAGKSSLLKILAEIEMITSGNIILWNTEKASISYCPEESVLWTNLTVKEHLKLFASLYGNSYNSVNTIVDRLISDLGMERYANTKVQHISGGYQRKLNVAISLLGFANMALLDEPTTGLDLDSKRLLWARLQREFHPSSKRLLFITTHSSDEVELYCSKIGLLVDGTLRCFGTKESLKKELIKNFELKIKLLRSENIEDTDVLSSLLPQAVKVYKKKNVILCYIAKESIQKFSTLFRVIEKIKNLSYVEECYFSEVTLNQVILEQIESMARTIANECENYV